MLRDNVSVRHHHASTQRRKHIAWYAFAFLVVCVAVIVVQLAR